MPSRLWLAAAFVLAFGPSPAHAETDLIAVTLDQAKIAKLPAGATTLIIGNPMIADVTMLKNNNSMVITGKGFGQTNLIAIDAAGSIIEERQVRVLPAKTVLVLQNGTSRISYACNPECMPTVQTRRRQVVRRSLRPGHRARRLRHRPRSLGASEVA